MPTNPYHLLNTAPGGALLRSLARRNGMAAALKGTDLYATDDDKPSEVCTQVIALVLGINTTDLAAGIKHVHRNFSKVSGELKVLYECAPGQASSRRRGTIPLVPDRGGAGNDPTRLGDDQQLHVVAERPGRA